MTRNTLQLGYTHKHGFLLEVTAEWGFALALCHFEEKASFHLQLLFGSILIRLPQWCWRPVPMGEMMNTYGFGWRWGRYDMGRDMHFNWGNKYKIIRMPWDHTFIRRDVLMDSGRWKRVGGTFDHSSCPWNWTDKYQRKYKYRYQLEDGTIQHRLAIIGVDEREWRFRWLKWCKYGAKVVRSIDVTFDEEVGERSGSWKGGCTGCGYDTLPGESPYDCLKRMERERKF